MSAVRDKVWCEVWKMASSSWPARRALNDQWYAWTAFYEDVTGLHIPTHPWLQDFFFYNPPSYTERFAPGANALFMLEELRAVSVCSRSERWDEEKIKAVKQWAYGVLQYLSIGAKGFEELGINDKELVNGYAFMWADSVSEAKTSKRLVYSNM